MVRDSPWDDYSRAEALADLIRRERIHQACGNDIDKAFNPDTKWYVDHTMVCQACATRDMVTRKLEKEHEHDKPHPNVPSFHDGRIILVRPANERDLRSAVKGRAATLTRV